MVTRVLMEEIPVKCVILIGGVPPDSRKLEVIVSRHIYL